MKVTTQLYSGKWPFFKIIRFTITMNSVFGKVSYYLCQVWLHMKDLVDFVLLLGPEYFKCEVKNYITLTIIILLCLQVLSG